MTLFITEEDCEKLLSIQTTIPIIEDVFRMAGAGNVENPPRLRMPLRNGELQFGPAALHAQKVMGFKLSTARGSPGRRLHDYVYCMETGELLAIIEARTITKFRTCATAAIAVKYLSPVEARVVGMYGAGRHAEAHLEAICSVRPIQTAHVYSRDSKKLDAFCGKMAVRLGIEVVAMPSPEHVTRDADIIVAITDSVTPVVRGDWIVRPGLVVGAGANQWYEREIDEKLVGLAKLVVVDEKESSKVEGGDLLMAVTHGLLRWEQVKSLGEVVAGLVPLPNFSSGIILFESQGLAMEDVAIAARAYELAKAQGIGRDIPL